MEKAESADRTAVGCSGTQHIEDGKGRSRKIATGLTLLFLSLGAMAAIPAALTFSGVILNGPDLRRFVETASMTVAGLCTLVAVPFASKALEPTTEKIGKAISSFSRS